MNSSKITRVSAVSAGFSPSRPYLYLKRALDLVLSSVLLAVFAVPMLFIALSVKLDSRGPAVFSQTRVGKDGKCFTIYKFRTMYVTAPHDVPSSELRDREKHVTRVGALLRRTSLDELPQLYNVMRGDMSLVGFRPLCKTERELNSLRLASGAMSLRPGITGLAQVMGRDALDDTQKLRYDADYLAVCSLKTDVTCLFLTVFSVLGGKGAN